jgi:hypothetical protein
VRGDEVRALRELRRRFPDSAFVFPTERGGPFTSDAVNRLIKRIGVRAGFDFKVHCHMLRGAWRNTPVVDFGIFAVAAGSVSSGNSRHSNSYACKRGEYDRGCQRSANSGLRGTDAEHHSILSGTEQHHQASQYCHPQQFAHWVLLLYVQNSFDM